MNAFVSRLSLFYGVLKFFFLKVVLVLGLSSYIVVGSLFQRYLNIFPLFVVYSS